MSQCAVCRELRAIQHRPRVPHPRDPAIRWRVHRRGRAHDGCLCLQSGPQEKVISTTNRRIPTAQESATGRTIEPAAPSHALRPPAKPVLVATKPPAKIDPQIIQHKIPRPDHPRQRNPKTHHIRRPHTKKIEVTRTPEPTIRFNNIVRRKISHRVPRCFYRHHGNPPNPANTPHPVNLPPNSVNATHIKTGDQTCPQRFA